MDNNRVNINGTLESGFSFDHEVHGEKFYASKVVCKRLSGTADIIPIMVSERLIDVNAGWEGKPVQISGTYRSHNNKTGKGNHIVLTVFVEEIVEAEKNNRINEIFLNGYICKDVIYRKTPLGREIADVLLAVNRKYGKSDYIPCVVWGRNAKFAQYLDVGTNIAIEGRVQSREYKKQVEEGVFEKRTAYEVSVSSIELCDKEEADENI